MKTYQSKSTDHPSDGKRGVHQIRKPLIYLRKAFLEHVVVELVYKSDKKSTTSV